ncbi:MAG TPA: PEP-CTERM sorting domain-containing protein [Gemmatales bacterium]|nr:PEP-CTERM sorting domain-containing protein [Gemmatales bacterium]HMP59251.1 PEP-CTERM sorting domain-containing protein [Gemmatales bacterium]
MTGLEWRLPSSATGPWPAAEVSFTAFDIYLSGSVDPADRSLTFANNIVGPQTQVRSGALVIPVDSFPSGGSPNDFGFFIGFNPYLYSGSNLLLELRHTGFTGTSRSVDAIGTAIPGYGTLFSAAWTGSYAGLSGSQGNFSVTRFTAAPIPEPGSILLLATGSVVGAWGLRSVRRIRRKRRSAKKVA